MKNSVFKKTIIAALCIMAICLPASSANPGSADDPLITKSYVDSILMPQVKSYVDSMIESIPRDSFQEVAKVPVSAGGQNYTVVNVSSGQTIIGTASCHMILRMGSASVVATDKGGLCNVTLGIDLKHGSDVPANHLLIVPLSDGRGVRMNSDGILMISGQYSVR